MIPTYNSERFISETLDSVLGQTYPNWECIIVDDGSTDRTIDICNEYLKKDNRFKFFKRDRQPKNASTCRNIAFEKSGGDYIIFLDSDDLLAEFCLEQRFNYISQKPDLDFAVFQMKTLSTNKLLVKEKKDYIQAFIAFDLPWAITCPIWKSSFFKKINGFDESFERIQDPELHLRALLLKPEFKVLYDFKPDCFYRFIQKNDNKFNDKKFNGLYKYLKFCIDNSKSIGSNSIYILKSFNILILIGCMIFSKNRVLRIIFLMKNMKNKKFINVINYYMLLCLFFNLINSKTIFNKKIILLLINLFVDYKNFTSRLINKMSLLM